MLSLTDGFSIEGVDFFRDDEKPELFYYLPTQVEIARAADGRPQFQMTLYQTGLPIAGRQSGGGFLLFTSVLSADPQVVGNKARDEARRILRAEAGTAVVQIPEPLIRPVNFLTGTAKLIATRAGGLVETIDLGRPSLFGLNTVTVLADLTLDGAQVFADILRQGGSVGALEYNLEFEVRLPAVTIDAHISASRVREAVAEFTVQDVKGKDVWGNEFTATRVRQRTGFSEFLRENNLVELDIKTGSSTVDIGSDIIDDLRDFALGAMDKFVAMEWMGTGGILTDEQLQSEWLEFVEEDFTRDFDMHLTQSDVIRRPYNPSATINPAFVGAPVSDVLTVVDTLAHPFFHRLEVNISTSFDFARFADYVHSIVVTMAYTGQSVDGRAIQKSESFIFTRDNTTPRSFVSAKGRPQDNEYEITAEVHYRNGPVTKRRLFQTRSVSPAQVIDVANPGEIEVTFAVPAAAFVDGLKAVEVELSYQDRANGVKPFTEAAVLDPENLTATIRKPIYVPETRPFSYRYVHVFETSKVASAWIEAPAGTRNLRIPTPFRDRLAVDVIASADWTEVDGIVVNLSYEDTANDLRGRQSLMFTAQDAGRAKSWGMALADPARRDVAVSETQMMRNGAVRQLPTRTLVADGRALIVGNAPGGTMKLTLSGEDIDLGGAVRRVSVALEHTDPVTGIIDRHRAILRTATDVSVWTVALTDPALIGYSYSIDYTLTSGERIVSGPVAGRFFLPDDWLILPPPPVP